MGAATFTADALLDLALAPKTAPLVRLVLVSAERADRHGVAEWDRGELGELISEGLRYPVGHGELKNLVRIAALHGHIMEGSTPRRVRLDMDRIAAHGEGLDVGDESNGLRVVKTVGVHRLIAECQGCGSVRTFQRSRLEDGSAFCARCTAPRAAAA